MLTAAAEMLAGMKAPDAEVKRAKANELLRRLSGGISKDATFNMATDGQQEHSGRTDRLRVTYARGI